MRLHGGNGAHGWRRERGGEVGSVRSGRGRWRFRRESVVTRGRRPTRKACRAPEGSHSRNSRNNRNSRNSRNHHGSRNIRKLNSPKRRSTCCCCETSWSISSSNTTHMPSPPPLPPPPTAEGWPRGLTRHGLRANFLGLPPLPLPLPPPLPPPCSSNRGLDASPLAAAAPLRSCGPCVLAAAVGFEGA